MRAPHAIMVSAAEAVLAHGGTLDDVGHLVTEWERIESERHGEAADRELEDYRDRLTRLEGRLDR